MSGSCPVSGAPTGPAPVPPKDHVTFEGDLGILNLEQRYLIINDKAGAPIGRVDWPEKWDWKLKKQKVSYYVKAVCEVVTHGDKTFNLLVDWPWVDRPKDWPRPGSKGSGGGAGRAPYRSPEDEKRISFNGILNSSIATVLGSKAAAAMTPEQVRTEVLKCQQAYLKSLEEYLKDGEITTPGLPPMAGQPLSKIITATG